MKKLGIIALSGLLCFSILLSGCSSGKPVPSTAPSDQPAADKLSYSDVTGEGVGVDYGFGALGFDLEKVIEHMGPENVKGLKLGVMVSQQSNNWQIMWADEFRRLADVYGFELVLLSADGDMIKEVDNLNSLVNQDVDGIIIYPQGEDSLLQTINAVSSRIPIVNAIPIPNSNVAVTINVDQKDKGRMIADHVAEDANGEEVNVMIIDWSTDMAILRDRVDGFVEQAEQYPNIHVVEEKRGGNSDEWLNVSKETLLSNEGVNCVVATYTEPMMGAYNAIQQLGLEDEVKVYGVDADEATLALLRDGKINGLHVQWPHAQAYTCLFALLCTLDGVEDVPETIYEAENYAMFYADESTADQVMKILYPNV